MLDVDAFLARTYDPAKQNCWHMVRDAWRDLTGRDIGDRTPAEISDEAFRARFDSDVGEFRQLPGPVDPCIVLMTRRRVVPHVGVLLARRVLQMTARGPSLMPLDVASAGFQTVRFFHDR